MISLKCSLSGVLLHFLLKYMITGKILSATFPNGCYWLFHKFSYTLIQIHDQSQQRRQSNLLLELFKANLLIC